MKPLLFLSIFAALTATVARADTIENESLVLEWSQESGTLRSAGDGGAKAEKIRFPWPVVSVESTTTEDATFGSGKSLILRHDNDWKTTLTLFDKSPFLHCSTIIKNPGGETLALNKFPSVRWNADLRIPATDVNVIGTGGLTTVARAEGSYTFSIMADPDSRRGVVAGWMTHRRGIGLFFPELSDDKLTSVRSEIEFGRLQVESGKSRATETLLIGLFDDCREGIEAYADAVAQSEAIRLKPKPSVYCTWYHAGASTEKKLTENTRFASAQLKPFGLSVMQIDDLWQTPLPKGKSFDIAPNEIEKHGPYKVFVDANQKYPNGMAAMAKEIASQNMVPGIWFMPFAGNHHNPYFDPSMFAKRADGTPYDDSVAKWSGTCIDMSNPAGEAFVRQRVRRIYDWGYRYFKIDGAHAGIPSPNIYINTSYKNDDFGEALLHDPAVTHAEAYRRGLRALQREAPEAFVLGCNVSQNMRSMGPAFGLLDAMRIGPDNGKAGQGRWDHVTRGAWHGTNLYFLNNRVWYNDPDPVFVRASNPIESVRWMSTWMAIAGALHTSSEQYADLPEERLDILKRCLPSHQYPARPVDYLESNRPKIWMVSNQRVHLLGLFNWDEKKPAQIKYPLERLGLDAETQYVGFDFWGNQFVEPTSGELNVTLPAGTCMSLAIRSATNHPQVVSTSRHITQGLMDVQREDWDVAKKTLSGTSEVVAGDRYEMRVVAPTEFDVKSVKGRLAEVEWQVYRKSNDPPDTCRVVSQPNQTGAVNWVIQF